MRKVHALGLFAFISILGLNACSTNNLIVHKNHNGRFKNCSICNNKLNDEQMSIISTVTQVQDSSITSSNENETIQILSSEYSNIISSIKNNNDKIEHVIKIGTTKQKIQSKASVIVQKIESTIGIKNVKVNNTEHPGLGKAITGIVLGVLGLLTLFGSMLTSPIGLAFSIVAWKNSTKGDIARTLAIIGTIFNAIVIIFWGVVILLIVATPGTFG